MNILLVYAHPEPTSLNGSLKEFTVNRLEKSGHRVQVSDLYAMKWKSALDADDFPHRDKSVPFHPSLDSQKAFEQGTQSVDIAKEQKKLLWADALILQFPLWWYSMPAILKGWIDRVYAYGFAYGVGEHSDTHWGDRFGDGVMKGKRAMLLVTVGGWEPHYSARGINGPMDDLLFPIHHGVLWYPGFDVLPPSVIYRTGKMDQKRMAHIQDELGQKLDNLWNIPPIAFRRQNDGDYVIPSLTLSANIMPEQSGFSIHIDA
ncbi:NAD(P)H-dependent oxidoreductase [Leminorella grimontii]|uniref:NAD(P)H-dependent oxidoreductase n=1 Tax=Leminorella grimontii TaxID=82981 RepID=UPI00208C47CA|nr:NAD(P)H-dependent oxidoreductase [Leminorella grimontii]GKX59057.1 dehydrogenase [Leminorella grimontii]